MKLYKIKEIADIAGISVRTLHHYDEIELLKPYSVNDSGYRFYSIENLERLQQILFFKELDFNLHTIKEILDNPKFNRKEALKSQKKLLEEKINRLIKINNTLEKTLNRMEEGKEMSEKEMFNGFSFEEIEKYKDEVRNKYGNTNAYKESNEKTKNYKNSDWTRISSEMNHIFIKIAEKMNLAPESKEVQDLIENWRIYISNNFYNCTLDIFKGLGQMYVCDERFKNNIDKIKPGLAEFISNAIEIYCK